MELGLKEVKPWGFLGDMGQAVHDHAAMARGTMYRPFEAHAREAACNLFKTQEGM